MDLSKNSISTLTGLQDFSKMKQLIADENSINEVSFCGLSGVEYISLRQNMIRELTDTQDLRKLINLDLSHNELTSGFTNLSKLKSLRVLDLGFNGIDMLLRDFSAEVIEHLKQLPKLEYLSFEGNPVERNIRDFRLYITYELPKLHYLDWVQFTKDDRAQAAALGAKGTWSATSTSFGSLPQPSSQPTSPQQQQQQQQQISQGSQQQQMGVPAVSPGLGTISAESPMGARREASHTPKPLGEPLPGINAAAAIVRSRNNREMSPSQTPGSRRSFGGVGNSGNIAAFNGSANMGTPAIIIQHPQGQPQPQSQQSGSLELEDMLASLTAVSNDGSVFNFDEYNERLVKEDASKAQQQHQQHQQQPPVTPSPLSLPSLHNPPQQPAKVSTPPVRRQGSRLSGQLGGAPDAKHDSMPPPARKPLAKGQLGRRTSIHAESSPPAAAIVPAAAAPVANVPRDSSVDALDALSSAVVCEVQPIRTPQAQQAPQIPQIPPPAAQQPLHMASPSPATSSDIGAEDVVKSLEDISKEFGGGYDPILESFLKDLGEDDDDDMPPPLAPVKIPPGGGPPQIIVGAAATVGGGAAAATTTTGIPPSGNAPADATGGLAGELKSLDSLMSEMEQSIADRQQKAAAEEAERQRKAAEEAEAEKRRIEEEEKRRIEEEKRRKAEEEERQRRAEEERKRAAEEAERRRIAEEAAERQRKAEEQRRREEQRRKLEEERVRYEEQQRLDAERRAREAAEAKVREAAEAEERRIAAEAERQRKAEEIARAARASQLKTYDVGRMKVIARLGCGTLGDTLKVSYTGDHRYYTVKVLRPQPAANGIPSDGVNCGGTVADAEMEVGRLAQVKRHKNVLPVLGVSAGGSSSSSSSATAFVAGYAAGPAVCEFTRVLPGKEKLGERLAIAQGIARGLAHLHNSGVLHGALKPADILLSEDLVPLIRDYGFLPFKERALRSGLLLDPFYIAPEIREAAAKNNNDNNASNNIDNVTLPFTAQSDLYSLGIVLWQMFEGAEHDVARDYRAGRALRLRYTSTPAEIVAVIERCCRADPRARPSGASEVAVELCGLRAEALHVGELPGDLREKHAKLGAIAQKVVALLQAPQPASVLHGVRAVGVLGQTAENAPSIWEEGVHMCLVRRLPSEDPAVVEAVVRQLQDLCDRPPPVGPEFRAEVARVVPPETLLALLLRDLGDALLGRALLLVATLLREDAVRRGLYAHGATRTLLKHMCSPADMVAMNATRAMANYLKLAEARDSFLNSKGLQFMAALLRRSAANPGITVFLLGVVAHLFQHEGAVPGLLELGAVARVRSLLQPRGGLLAHAAAKCAAKLAASPAARAAHPGEEWIPLVTPLLGAQAPRIRAHACSALARFATSDDFCDTLESAGTIPTLLAILRCTAEPDDVIGKDCAEGSAETAAAAAAEKRRDARKLVKCVVELLTRLAQCISCRDAILDNDGMREIAGAYGAYVARHPEDYATQHAFTKLFLALIADNDSAMEALCEHELFAQRLVRQLAIVSRRCNNSIAGGSASTAGGLSDTASSPSLSSSFSSSSAVGGGCLSEDGKGKKEDGGDDSEHLVAALKLVAALAAGSAAVVDVVLRAGGLEMVCVLLESSQGHMVSEEVPPTAGAAMAALLKYDAVLEELERVPRGFYLAFDLLNSGIAPVQEAVLAQLYGKCAQKDTLTYLVRMGLMSHVARFLKNLENPVQLQSKALQLVIVAIKAKELREELIKNGVLEALGFLSANSGSPLIKGAAAKVSKALRGEN